MTRPAFDTDAVYAQMAPRVLALGLHLTGDRHAAEDVLQETFLAVHRYRRGFRGKAKLETWVYRIAIHTALRARRRHALRRHASFDAGTERAPAQPKAEDGQTPEHREQVHRLRDAMARLTEPQRVVLSLQALRGVPAATIAEILDVPVGTVHSRGHAARQRLRELLGTDARATPPAQRAAPEPTSKPPDTPANQLPQAPPTPPPASPRTAPCPEAAANRRAL